MGHCALGFKFPRIRGFEPVKGFEDSFVKPVRKTKHSAGYDLHAAEDTVVPSIWMAAAKLFHGWFCLGFKDEGEKVMGVSSAIKPTIVKTGVKAYMPYDEYLHCVNRSSGPIKRGLVYSPGAGVIDSDYYNAEDTEGHIMMQFYNFGIMPYTIKAGEAIGQVVFTKYLIADKDVPGGERTGGFGSTDE